MASNLLGPHLAWALLAALIMLACIGLAVFGVVAAVYGLVKRGKKRRATGHAVPRGHSLGGR